MKQLLLFLLLPFTTYSQQLDDIVVSAVEAPVQGSDGGQLMWTLGELMVEYYANGPVLDQGYLQPRCLLSPVNEVSVLQALGWNAALWPNPSGNGQVNFRADAHLLVTLFNNLGQRLQVLHCAAETLTLDLSSWPAGSYWLHALDREGRSRTFQIQKL